jgi:peptide/nickel transport system permease protein
VRRPSLGHWGQALRTPVGIVALVGVGTIVALAVFAPLLWSDEAARFDIPAASQGASLAHPLGTDALGRDIFHRVLVATRLSVTLAVLATLIGALIGIPLGAMPSLVGERLGRTITSFINLAIAFPALLIAIFVAAIVGIGARGAVFGIGCAVAPYFARLTQTLSSSVIDSDYVASARVLGVRRARLFTRHVLPNVAEPLLLTSTLAVGEALLALAGLSFLGLGVQPPTYDWGRMLNEGIGRIYVTPIVAIGPAVAIVLAALVFTLLGETLAKGAAGQQTTARWRGRPDDADAVLEPAAGDGIAISDEDVIVVDSLTVSFPGGSVPVRGVSIVARAGEIVGIVGESGSGKTLTAMAIADLLPPSAHMSAAHYRIRGRDPRELSDAEKRKLLGGSLAIVYQDPMSSLNPALRVGRQLGEVSEVHAGLSRAHARVRTIDGLRAVRIGNPEARLRQYPHEFSGGMRQRAVIAMGLMIEPKLLIADEPTTALDVTVQQQILRLLRDVSRSRNAAALFISHDVAVVSQLCSRVVVMYAGRIVEELEVANLVRGPAHPYTAALVASVPTMESARDRPLAAIPGRAPGPYDHSPGCPYHPRCPVATDRCRTERPQLESLAAGQRVACWNPLTRDDLREQVTLSSAREQDLPV